MTFVTLATSDTFTGRFSLNFSLKVGLIFGSSGCKWAEPMALSGTWRELYEAALAETDAGKLPERIEQARSAIMARVDELIDDPNRKPEHDEILSALNKLNHLASSSSTGG